MFELSVSDGQMDSVAVRVVVTVVNTINDAPVAVAGPAQSVGEQSAVVLDAGDSNDPNGDAITYTWTQTSGPVVELSQSGSARWDFTSPRVVVGTVLEFSLTVHDGELASAASFTTIAIENSLNEVPFADPGPGQSVEELATIALDGSGSSDPNGDALTYQWSIVANDSALVLSFDDPTAAAPTVGTAAIFAHATVEFELVVFDGTAFSAPMRTTVEVLNTINEPPAANAGHDQFVVAGQDVRLDAGGSTDLNGDALQYHWTFTGGVVVDLLDADTMTPHFECPEASEPQQLTFTLVVTDSHGDTSSDQVVIDVAAAVGPPQIVSTPRSVGIAGDPYLYDDDGMVGVAGTPPLSFELISGPAGLTIDSATGRMAWVADEEGIAVISLRVSNAGGSAEQSFTVEIFGAPQITSTPSTQFLLSAIYTYDGSHLLPPGTQPAALPTSEETGVESVHSGPTVIGSTPMYWSLVSGPDAMVVSRDTGELFWQPEFIDAVQVVLRVSNAFGQADQSFEIARVNDGIPTIAPTANPWAAVHTPYLFDEDSRVSLLNASTAETVVMRVLDAPRAFYVHPVSHAVSWVPAAAGPYNVTLGLETPQGTPLSDYTFTIDVQASGGNIPDPLVTANPQSGQGPLTVVFDGSRSTGTNQSDILMYRWDFGDDERLKTGEAIVSHTYAHAGRYDAVLTISDVLGLSHSTSVEIGVSEQSNTPPTAVIEADSLEGRDQLTVRFNCRCGDVDGELRSVLWTFGDGESSSLKSPAHTYLQPGRYHARVLVRDSAGLTASDSVDVSILSAELRAPAVTIFATPSEGERPLRVEFSLEASVPGQDPTYIWNLGAGDMQSSPQFSKVYFDSGYYDVTVEMRSRDSEGNVLRSFDQRSVFVTAEGLLPPRIVSFASNSAVVGVPYRYDEDGRPSAQGSQPMVWRLGKQMDGVMLGHPDGMSIDLKTGELSWTPSEEQLGKHTVMLLAESPAGIGTQQIGIEVHPAHAVTPPTRGCQCAGTSVVDLGWCGLMLTGLLWGRRRSRRFDAMRGNGL